MAKGATIEEAQRLHTLKQSQENKKNNIDLDNTKFSTQQQIDDNNNNNNDDDDEKVLRRYREKRLQELKREKYGTVIPIERREWNHQINETSKDGTWVIINLTSQKSSPNVHPMHKDICLLIENEIIPLLACKYPAIKFVSIPSTSAIENWPETNLPTLFCYRFGQLQCQLVGLQEFGVQSSTDVTSLEQLEFRLGKLGIIDCVGNESDDYDDVD